jgi:predicted nucleic acid-binding protein
MTDAVFVDTNVLVYARDTRDRSKQRAAADWLQTLWQEQRGRVSVQVLSEYYVTVTRTLTPGMDPDDAWDDVQHLLAWEPQRTDGELLIAAREVERRFRISWWDALIVAAAQLQGCSTLLTEDLQHGMVFGGVRVRDPFRTAVEASRPDDAGASSLALRHRRRGRPARVATRAT